MWESTYTDTEREIYSASGHLPCQKCSYHCPPSFWNIVWWPYTKHPPVTFSWGIFLCKVSPVGPHWHQCRPAVTHDRWWQTWPPRQQGCVWWPAGPLSAGPSQHAYGRTAGPASGGGNSAWWGPSEHYLHMWEEGLLIQSVVFLNQRAVMLKQSIK